jgi:hypothetical protein
LPEKTSPNPPTSPRGYGTATATTAATATAAFDRGSHGCWFSWGVPSITTHAAPAASTPASASESPKEIHELHVVLPLRLLLADPHLSLVLGKLLLHLILTRLVPHQLPLEALLAQLEPARAKTEPTNFAQNTLVPVQAALLDPCDSARELPQAFRLDIPVHLAFRAGASDATHGPGHTRSLLHPGHPVSYVPAETTDLRCLELTTGAELA